MFRRNVGGLDRAARLALGVVFLVAGLLSSGEYQGYRLMLLALGLLGLITGGLGFCPPYLLFGFSTARPGRPPGGETEPRGAKPVRRALRLLGGALALLLGVALGSGAVAALVVWSRAPLVTVASTTHPTLARQACLECHAPIAAEWRQSAHFKSLRAQPWSDVRRLGYLKLFNPARKKCVNCHAPANVLDLADTRPAGGDEPLGVECTPSLLREPRGIVPAARADDVDLGVDCTSCHVSTHGISGPGRRPTEAHETLADARFQSAARTAESVCRTCHRATVEAWKRTGLAVAGTTCADCHMPATSAPSVAGGPPRARRSHSFVADKDPAMLAKAINASLDITPDGRARLRIVNDRVGHYFPSGGNWLLVQFTAQDATGGKMKEERVGIGRDEGLVLDFWPFARDRRIAFGEQRDVFFSLPAGHGTVEAAVRYHDWERINPTLVTLQQSY